MASFTIDCGVVEVTPWDLAVIMLFVYTVYQRFFKGELVQVQEKYKGEDIVISAVAGRFPGCMNVMEFKEKLLKGEDLITGDASRWKKIYYDLYNIPRRHGKLDRECLESLDAEFFNVKDEQARYMDPQMRIALEVAYEALIDAGVNSDKLRGSNTGVYYAVSQSENQVDVFSKDPQTISVDSIHGNNPALLANLISYSLDLRGPSELINAACSGSLVAFEQALMAIRMGRCEQAIVIASHLVLTATTMKTLREMNMIGMSGKCQSFDAAADGYCASEAVVAILLQRRSKALRVYMEVIEAICRNDGFKSVGISEPSAERQAELLREIYRQAGIDPAKVYYVEAHGTGTLLGDNGEGTAIGEVFCGPERTNQLLIGSVKSNVGHTEPVSFLTGLVKLIIAAREGRITANLHFTGAKDGSKIKELIDGGRLKVVTNSATPLPPGSIVGVSSMGIGGNIGHAILRIPATEEKEDEDEMVSSPEVPNIPRLVLCAGRTESGVEAMLEAVKQHSDDVAFRCLVENQANINPKHAPFRGFMILNPKEE